MRASLSSSTATTPTSEFRLNPAQVEANRLMGGRARHIMLYGGSRSGKSFVIIRAMVIRALKAAGSRHAVFRLRFNHVKNSIVFDTFPKVMKLCFPDVPYRLNQTDWFVEFPNGSQIIFAGLDDAQRTEKILGLEFATIFLNECSQISFDARNKAVTRLAQKCGLALKFYYDENPPTKAHWTYRLFEMRVDPKSGEALPSPEAYASVLMNPDANRENLAPEYIQELEALPEKDRLRFLHGKFLAQVDGALWTADSIRRCARAQLPNLVRVVVAVDPSGCSGPEDTRSDEIGIVVVGRDAQGNGYILEDLTGRYSPEGWARKAVEAFDRHHADRIVAEKNFGGSLVESNIKAVRKSAPVKLVTASRGKVQRAEPVSALYEQSKVLHVGHFPDLEEQLCNFSSSGYQGAKSPDRADAAVWGLTEILLESRAPMMISAAALTAR